MSEKPTEIRDVITSMRLMAFEKNVYLGPFIFGLTPVERPGIGTMAVDSFARMYYCPDFVASITPEQGAYVVLHETWHLILRHCHRIKEVVSPNPSPVEAEDWNIACDIAVWLLMEDYQHLAPGDPITYPWAKSKWPSIERNMTVPEMYSIIHESRKADTPPKDQKPEGGDGNDTGSTGQPTDGDAEQDNPSDGGEGSGSGKSGAQCDKDFVGGGSASDGITREFEEREPVSEWEAFVEDKLYQRIEQLEDEYKSLGRAIGSMPGCLAETIRNKLRPQPNPWDKLKSAVAKVAANYRGQPDYTYRRYSRRQAGCPDMPRLKGTRKYQPKVAVVIDTSGSMTTLDKVKSLNVVAQGLKAYPSFPVVCGDTRVSSSESVSSLADRFVMPGGGGTDMRVPLEFTVETFKPDVIVCCTDGWSPWPAKKTRYELVIALTDPSAIGQLPKWANIVPIPSTAQDKA